MNTRRRYQPISARQVDYCWDFGERLKAHYARGGSPNSRTVSGPWQADQREFALGKAAEVSAALFFGFDPNPGPRCPIKWSVDDGPDGGSDLIAENIRVDVKGSTPKGNLIWPLTKNGFYHAKRFDILLAVSVAERPIEDLSQCWIEGFVTKQEFFDRKKIAGADAGPRLTPGTWYLEKQFMRPLNGNKAPVDLLVDSLLQVAAPPTVPVNSRDGVDAVSEFIRSADRPAFADIWTEPFKDGGA